MKKATKEEDDETKKINEIFVKAAGDSQELGWAQLKKLLDSFLQKGLYISTYIYPIHNAKIKLTSEYLTK